MQETLPQRKLSAEFIICVVSFLALSKRHLSTRSFQMICSLYFCGHRFTDNA